MWLFDWLFAKRYWVLSFAIVFVAVFATILKMDLEVDENNARDDRRAPYDSPTRTIDASTFDESTFEPDYMDSSLW